MIEEPHSRKKTVGPDLTDLAHGRAIGQSDSFLSGKLWRMGVRWMYRVEGGPISRRKRRQIL